MRFSNRSGHLLELRLVDYEFPEIAGEDWDDNWLIVEGKVVTEGGAWSFRDPSMTTLEGLQLASWLTALADGHVAPESEIGFTEPNLSFVALNPGLRVFFELEARPPWATQAGAFSRDLFLDFAPTPQEAHAAAAALRSDLERLPPRGAWAARD